jgi:hypothetical protein
MADGEDVHRNQTEVGFRIVLAMRLSATAVLVLTSLALAGCGSGSDDAADTGDAGGAEAIEISETELALDPRPCRSRRREP